MEKQDVFSGERVLIAKENGAYALHETVQGGGEEDFAALTYIQAIWNLASISDFLQCSDDTLVTDELIEDGDKLYIIRNDDSIAEFVASGVSGSGPYTMDTTAVTAGEVPIYVYKDDIKLSYNGEEAILDTETLSIGRGTLLHGSEFLYNIDGWEQDGSSDIIISFGDAYLRLHSSGNDTTHIYELSTVPGEEINVEYAIEAQSGHARLYIYNEDNTLLHDSLDDDVIKDVNLIPTGNYIKVSLSLFDHNLIFDLDRLVIKRKSLEVNRWYSDMAISGQTLETRFDFGTKGNEMRYNKCSIFKDRV